MAIKSSSKAKLKKNTDTNLSLNLIFEMIKQYQMSTMRKEANDTHVKFYQGLIHSIHLHKWSYLNENIQLETQNEIKNIEEIKNFDLVNETHRHFGLIYQFNQPQKYIESDSCNLFYKILAITATQSKNGLRLRSHKYVINKGWVAEPYHFILPLDFLYKSFNKINLEIDIHHDLQLGHDIDSYDYQLEIKSLERNIEIIKCYFINKLKHEKTTTVFSEGFMLNHGKPKNIIDFEQVA